MFIRCCSRHGRPQSFYVLGMAWKVAGVTHNSIVNKTATTFWALEKEMTRERGEKKKQ